MADANLFAPIAAKLHCREVWESACQAAPSLRKISRNSVEYAFEPLDNFGKVIEEVDTKGASTAKACQTLGVAKGATAVEIKSGMFVCVCVCVCVRERERERERERCVHAHVCVCVCVHTHVCVCVCVCVYVICIDV
jgi:hypothetical protein